MDRTTVRPARRPAPTPGPALSLVLVAALLFPGAGAAQEQEGYTNLQVLPAEVSRGELMDVMRGFTQALGMRCTTCHVGQEGQPLTSYDFASDDKPAKLKAREMMRMVQAINGTHLATLPGRRTPAVDVTCVTCHRGVSRPEAIEAIVRRIVSEEGVDFAVDRYRTLRDRYFGSAAYDFTERPLILLSGTLAEEGDSDAALRLLALNLEYHPDSAQTLFGMARLHEDLGHVPEAIGLYERGLEIMPDNRQARQRLEALRGG